MTITGLKNQTFNFETQQPQVQFQSHTTEWSQFENVPSQNYFLGLLVAGCHYENRVETSDGVYASKGLTYNLDGRVKYGTLLEPKQIDGVLYGTGLIVFEYDLSQNNTRYVSRGNLGEPLVVNDLKLSAGDQIVRRKAGIIYEAKLLSNSTWREQTLAPGTYVYFSDDGKKVSSMFLSNSITLHGYTFAAHSTLVFDAKDSKQLKSGVVVEGTLVNGKPVIEDTLVFFDKDNVPHFAADL